MDPNDFSFPFVTKTGWQALCHALGLSLFWRVAEQGQLLSQTFDTMLTIHQEPFANQCNAVSCRV